MKKVVLFILLTSRLLILLCHILWDFTILPALRRKNAIFLTLHLRGCFCLATFSSLRINGIWIIYIGKYDMWLLKIIFVFIKCCWDSVANFKILHAFNLINLHNYVWTCLSICLTAMITIITESTSKRQGFATIITDNENECYVRRDRYPIKLLYQF